MESVMVGAKNLLEHVTTNTLYLGHPVDNTRNAVKLARL